MQSGADSTAFARFVWQQGRRGVGVPVLLFTDATLAATGADGSAPAVTAAAERAGLDPGRVELFSPEAYVLQGALAAAVLPGLGPSDDPAPVPAGPDVRSQPGRLTAPWTPAQGRALLAAPVLALNFHAIPRDDRATVRRQLERIAAFGPSLVLDPPPGPDAGPQVLVGFYDGFRDEGLWGAQVCAELGLRACFFPVSDHGPGSERTGVVELLTYGDLEQIGRVHTVGFHSATHRRAAEVGPADLRREVHEPLDAIAAATGRPVTVAAWRRGTRFDPDTLADRVLRERGVRHVISNWSVEAVQPARGSRGPGET